MVLLEDLGLTKSEIEALKANPGLRQRSVSIPRMKIQQAEREQAARTIQALSQAPSPQEQQIAELGTGSGWRGEPDRHALAAKGVRTGRRVSEALRKTGGFLWTGLKDILTVAKEEGEELRHKADPALQHIADETRSFLKEEAEHKKEFREAIGTMDSFVLGGVFGSPLRAKVSEHISNLKSPVFESCNRAVENSAILLEKIDSRLVLAKQLRGEVISPSYRAKFGARHQASDVDRVDALVVRMQREADRLQEAIKSAEMSDCSSATEKFTKRLKA